MPYQKFSIVSNTYSRNQQIKLSNTNSIQFINTGVVTATLNGTMVLISGQIITFNGNQNEILDPNQVFTLTFATGAGASVLVLQKNYM
jgi:archaellum component FlaF (FlaF/FlaG flagellin family)